MLDKEIFPLNGLAAIYYIKCSEGDWGGEGARCVCAGGGGGGGGGGRNGGGVGL